MKIFFVESLKKPSKIKYVFREERDITINSIFIASDSKIIGFIKHVFRPINCVLRSSHPITDISELEILSSRKTSTNSSPQNINNLIKLTHQTRAKRYEKLKSLFIKKIAEERAKRNELSSSYSFKKEKNGAVFFKKFFNINISKIFIAKQFYRFVLHLYWKYITSELNIFTLQAHVRERNFSLKLKKLNLQKFRLLNSHIKDVSMLGQLQPKVLKITPTQGEFEQVMWLCKSSIASQMIQEYS